MESHKWPITLISAQLDALQISGQPQPQTAQKLLGGQTFQADWLSPIV